MSANASFSAALSVARQERPTQLAVAVTAICMMDFAPGTASTVELNAGPHVMERKYKLRIRISASLNYLGAGYHITRHFWINRRTDRCKQMAHPADCFGDFLHPDAAKAKYQPLPRFP